MTGLVFNIGEPETKKSFLLKLSFKCFFELAVVKYFLLFTSRSLIRVLTDFISGKIAGELILDVFLLLSIL